ncbi:MAG: hypothetical protein FD123_30 [Bacteroidetes bacterium]|nr:MAG: hypothetical protein FD123_30 [Bacteroidota bacterium]
MHIFTKTILAAGTILLPVLAQAQCYNVTAIPYNPQPQPQPNVLSVNDDWHSVAIPIGFPFCFYGASYNNVVVSSNGYLTFDGTLASTFSQWAITMAIPSTASTPKNAIMFPWQDINNTFGGVITYSTTGLAPNRKFIVSFDSIPMYSCTTSYFTGQVVLSETSNEIETHILNKPLCAQWNAGKGIHGLHNQTGMMATVVPGRNSPTQWTATNDGYLFSPSCNVCSDVSVEEPVITDDGLSVFPNPANGKLNIRFKNPPAETYEIALADCSGRTVLQFSEQNGQEQTLDISTVAPGIYMLQLVSKTGERAVKKVIVE